MLLLFVDTRKIFHSRYKVDLLICKTYMLPLYPKFKEVTHIQWIITMVFKCHNKSDASESLIWLVTKSNDFWRWCIFISWTSKLDLEPYTATFIISYSHVLSIEMILNSFFKLDNKFDLDFWPYIGITYSLRQTVVK